MTNVKFDFEKFLGRIFIALLTALATFIAVDRLSIRLLPPKKTPVELEFASRDIRKPMPYVMFKGAPFAKAWKLYSPKTGYTDNILNELGYPGDAPPIPKPEKEYRIIVLGGSAVFMGNPAIPRLIQYQFEKKGCGDVKVYNFGVVSSVTSMELSRLVFEVVNYAPDLIISYSGFNDIDEPFVADPRPGYPFNYFIFESNPVLDSDIRNYPLFPLTAYASHLLRRFFPWYFLKEFSDLDKIKKEAGYGTEHWRQKIADIYVENMVKSRKIARAFNADFMAFFQPSLYFKNTVSAEEKTYLTADRKENSRELRELILKKIKKAQEKQGLYFSDLSDFFDQTPETVFEDRVHVIYTYKPVIAGEIYRHILKFIQESHPDGLSNPACK